jgi:hypothetical protein
MAFKIDVADDMAPVGHSVWPHWSPRLALVEHSVWPRLAPSIWLCLAPRLAPIRTLEKKFNFFCFCFGCCCRLEKKGKNISVFNPQDPRAPRASQTKLREEEAFFGLIPLVTHPSSIPLLGGLTLKFLSLSFHSL